MTNPEAILQLARLTGRDAFLQAIGQSSGEEPAELSDQQLEDVHALVDASINRIASGVLDEAMASDDVIDSASALVYLDDRLDFLGDLLTREQRENISAKVEGQVKSWG
jgi:hypothetical protein